MWPTTTTTTNGCFTIASLVLIVVSYQQFASASNLIAPIKTEQLTPGISHQNNFCERQALVDSGNLTLPLALKDMDISAHLMQWTPLHVRVGRDGKLDRDNPGILVNIMDNLATRGEFRWRDSFGVGLTPGSDGSNATFSEILMWALDTYDVSLGEWRNSVTRKGNGVAFPLGIADASVIMVQKEVSTAFNPFLYLQTFTWSVWIAIIATYIISGYLYRFIHVHGEGEHLREPKLRRRVIIYDSFMTLTQHNHFDPQSQAGRIFSFSINFFSMVIIASYTANLVTLLVLGQTPKYAAYTFREAEIKQIPICVWKGTSSHTHLKTKYPKAILVEAESRQMEYEYLNAGLCDIVSDTIQSWRSQQRNTTSNADCSLAQVGEPDVNQKAGFAMKGGGKRCSSLLTNVLDYHLSDMNVEDALERLWAIHLDLISQDFCTVDRGADEDVQKLDIKDLGGIFVTHAALVTISLIICHLEHRRKLALEKESNKEFRPKTVSTDDSRMQHSTINDYDQCRSNIEQLLSTDDNTTGAAFTKKEMREILEQFKDEIISSTTASNRGRHTAPPTGK